MVHACLAMPRVPLGYRVAEWLIERNTVGPPPCWHD